MSRMWTPHFQHEWLSRSCHAIVPSPGRRSRHVPGTASVLPMQVSVHLTHSGDGRQTMSSEDSIQLSPDCRVTQVNTTWSPPVKAAPDTR